MISESLDMVHTCVISESLDMVHTHKSGVKYLYPISIKNSFPRLFHSKDKVMVPLDTFLLQIQKSLKKYFNFT